MDATIPVLAGVVSTTIFAASAVPMLVKAGRSKDLQSYSLGNIGLSNVGNTVHSVYVFSLPAGPVWALHSFYTVVAFIMLVWYLRHGRPGSPVPESAATSVRDPARSRGPDATPLG